MSSRLKFYKNLMSQMGIEVVSQRTCYASMRSLKITVALGGDGGDEIFSGYSRYPGLNKKINPSSFL